MKPITYKEVIRKFTDEMMEDNELAWSPDRRRDYILCSMAEMLAIIADTLEGRNIELKDGKTAQDTMQDDI